MDVSDSLATKRTRRYSLRQTTVLNA